MRKLNERGVSIKLKLFSLGKSQEWLISEVKKTEPSFDSKALYDIMYAKRKSKYEATIKDILGIDFDEDMR
jgi:hypothetical protein